MNATTTSSGSRGCTAFPSVPSNPPAMLLLVPKQLTFSNIKGFNSIIIPAKTCSLRLTPLRSSSIPSNPLVEEEKGGGEEEVTASGSPRGGNDDLLLQAQSPKLDKDTNSFSSFGGCKACGRDEIERGCNGEGRIQGGIATIPGFGWWPIKAYRPCPAFVSSGGRYRRSGQSMDEVAFGRGGPTDDEGQSSDKKGGPRKLKR